MAGSTHQKFAFANLRLTAHTGLTNITMAPPIDREEQIQAALAAYRNAEFPSIEQTAEVYSIPARTFRRRYHGGKTRKEGQADHRRLTELEEDGMVR